MNKLNRILQSKFTYIFLVIIIAIYVFIGTVIIKYESKLDNNNSLTGVVTDLQIKEDKVSFTLKSDEKIICNYYTENTQNYIDLLGKEIKVVGNIKTPTNNTMPNTFNYRDYLYKNKIYYTYTVDTIEVLKEENILYKIKNMIINRINTFDDEVKTYLNLFILGDKAYLSDENYSNYQSNGIWHLFAISGMHISLIILILDIILKKIKFKNIIISIFLLYFMFLTNFSASVMRSTIFFLLKKLCNYYGVDIDNKKLLLLVASIILLFNPFMIYNAGFQYSFLITYSIMTYGDNITGNYFVKILKISILSFIVSLPITINLNYEINLLSIILNMFYVPFITFIVFPVSIITFILPFLSVVLEILIKILEYSNEIFNNLKINIIMPKMSVILIVLYYLFIFLFSKKNSKKYLFCLLIIVLLNKIIPKLDSNYYVYYLDVGQGDSTLLINPYKSEIIMIDTGGNFNSDYYVSDNTITLLKSLGIGKIDVLILTHGDYDHMGDAFNLVDNFKIDEVVFNHNEYNDLERELIAILKDKNINYYQKINELSIDDNKLYFLNNKMYDNENDNSNVIYTELEGVKLLLMGDAGVDVEEDILEKYNVSDIDILKVGHHGSKTSTSEVFVNSINPEYSIISVGRNNRYGHPNDNVLDNLESSTIYRTNLDGSIIFKIKNNKLEIETYVP